MAEVRECDRVQGAMKLADHIEDRGNILLQYCRRPSSIQFRNARSHINISGGGLLQTAPNRDAGIKFFEYLVSDSAQTLFANSNNEWPIVKGAKLNNPALESLGEFKIDQLPLASLGKSQAAAQRIADKVGWK